MKRRDSPVVSVRLIPPPLPAHSEAALLEAVGRMMLVTRPQKDRGAK